MTPCVSYNVHRRGNLKSYKICDVSKVLLIYVIWHFVSSITIFGNNNDLCPKRMDIYLDSADVLCADGRRFASVITRCAAVFMNPSNIMFVVRIFRDTAMNSALLIFPIMFHS
jgi:hypothetical protein